MSGYHEDFDVPSSRQVRRSIIGYGSAIVLGLFVLGLLGYVLNLGAWFVTKPIEMTKGVVDRVIDPDHALQTYRWFHETYQQINVKQSQIVLAKQALEASAPDRQEARRVELLGVQQGCQRLVGEYNAKATRADTVIFQHPEKFLPGNWPGERTPLPDSIKLSVCS